MRAPWIVPILLAPSAALAQVDLTTTSADVSPATVELGTMVTVSGEFGGTHLGDVAYRVVLSADTTLDPGDTTLHGASIPFDGTGNATPYSTSFSMPVVPAATWNVFVEIDSAGSIQETNESNNARTAGQMLTMRGADLRIGAISGPEYAFAGGPYPIELIITNEGEANATDFRYVYYYSDTPQIRVFSTALGTFGPVSVAAGGQLAVSDVIMLPTSTATGYIGVILDQFGAVPESNLANNIGRIVSEVRILEPSPELGGQLIEVPGQAAIGEQLAITRTLENSGVIDADVEYAFYLSTDPTISTSDVEIGRFSAMIEAGADDYAIDLMNVPFAVVPGNYWVGMIVDPDDVSLEPNEGDNVSIGPQIQVYESAIEFVTTSLPDATVGVQYEVGVYANGPLTVTFSVEEGALPDGLTLDPAGLITGAATASGRFDFTLRAHAGTAIADRRFSLLVIETTIPLEVVPIALPTGVIGRPYQAELVAVGGQPPYSWNAVAELPQGLSLSAEGRITGTPVLDGQHPIAVRVLDSIGDAHSRDLLLRVITPDQTLEIRQVSLPDAIIGQEYCDQSMVRFEAMRGVEPYTWSATGDLPPGMTLSSDGALCGAPSRVGSFAFTVRAADQTGLFDSALFTLEVASESSFVISTTTLPDAESGKAYDAAIEVLLGEEMLAFSTVMGAGELPPGLALGADGSITGTPTTEGVFAFVVHVVDGSNRSDTQPLSIAVLPGKTIPKKDGGCTCTSMRSFDSAYLAGLLLLFGLLLLRRGH
jgi:hypothetical protein